MKKNKSGRGSARGQKLSAASMKQAKGGLSVFDLSKAFSGPNDKTVVDPRYLALIKIRSTLVR